MGLKNIAFSRIILSGFALAALAATFFAAPAAGAEWDRYIDFGAGYPHYAFMSIGVAPVWELNGSGRVWDNLGVMVSGDLGVGASSFQLGLDLNAGLDNPDSYNRLVVSASYLITYDIGFQDPEAYIGFRANAHGFFIGLHAGVYKSMDDDGYLGVIGIRIGPFAR